MSVSTVLTPIARWRVSGASDAAQGADGVLRLARTAFDAMCASPWEQDTSEPVLPVHEYDRERPFGQAYKAVWGYDAEARTERSCCGAACHTYRIPDDALAETYEPTMDTEVDGSKTYYTRSGSGMELDPYVFAAVADPDAEHVESYYESKPATILSVAVPLLADRYCARGVQLYAELSDSFTPCPVAEAVSAAANTPAFLVGDDQIDWAGDAIPPNRREEMSGAVAYVFAGSGAAPAKYLHVHLVMADYLGVRDAWIEGGAIFASQGADVEFSRGVEFAGADDVAGVLAMDVGHVMGATSTTSGAAALMAKVPRLSLWENVSIQAASGVFDGFDDAAALFRNLLAFFCSGAALYDAQGTAAGSTVAGSATRALSCKGGLGFEFDLANHTAPAIHFATFLCHGLTQGRVFRGIEFASEVDFGMAVRLVAYGIDGTPAFASSPKCATALPWWGDVISRQWRDGEATAARFLGNPASDASGIGAEGVGSAGTAQLPVVPLAAADIAAPVTRIPFDRPWATGELSSLALSVFPAGVPAASGGAAATYDASVTRNFTLTLPNSGYTEAKVSAISGSLELSTGNISYRLSASPDIGFLQNLGALPKNVFWNSSEAQYSWRFADWPRAVSGNNGAYPFNFVTNQIVFSLSNLSFSFEYNGHTYTYSGGSKVESTSSECRFYFEGLYKNPQKLKISCGWITIKPFTVTATTSWTSGGRTQTHSMAVKIKDASGAAGINGTYLPVETIYQAQTEPRTVTFSADKNEFEVPVNATYAGGNSYQWVNTYAYNPPYPVGGTVQCAVTDGGTVSFEKDGETYTATIPAGSSTLPVDIYWKGGKGNGVSGNDLTAHGMANFTAPARELLLEFASGTGKTLWGAVTLPARRFDGNWREGAGMTAKNVYLQQSQNPSMAYGGTDNVSVSQGGRVTELNLGVVRLYE